MERIEKKILLRKGPEKYSNRRILMTGICLILYLLGISSQLAAQSPVRYQWKNVTIGGGGFVSGIITSKEQPGLIYARTDVGGAYRWDKASKSWIPLMDWVSPQQLGIFGVESVAIDPQKPNIVYAFAGISYFNNCKSYILRSEDYGANFSVTEVTSQFTAHGNGPGRQSGEKLQVDPLNSSVLYCGTRSQGLFKSTDAGSSWKSLKTPSAFSSGVNFVILDKTSASGNGTERIFVGVSSGKRKSNLYKSDDAGRTFQPIVNSRLGKNLRPQRAVLASNGYLYVTYANGEGPNGTPSGAMNAGEVWKYHIAGNKWTKISPPGKNMAFSGISIDPLNPERLVVSSLNRYLSQGRRHGDRFFISSDGGATWTDIIARRGFEIDANGYNWIRSSSIHWAGCIEFDPAESERVWVTSGNGIFVNENISSSRTWKFEVKGLEETVPLNLLSIPNGPLISAIGDYDGFVHTDLARPARMHAPFTGTVTGLSYAFSNPAKIFRAGDSVYYSVNSGRSWTKTGSMKGPRGHLALSTDGSVVLHCPEGSETAYRSTNNGNSWTVVKGLSIGDGRPFADGLNPDKFYAYDTTEGTLMVSTDKGASFSPAASTGSGGLKLLQTVPGREGHIWIARGRNGLMRSVNSGTTVVKVPGITYCRAIGIGKAAPDSKYETLFIYGTVNGISGIFRSTDEGTSWVRINDDQHQYGGPANGDFVVGDMNVFGRVYMSTAGRGIVYGDIAEN